MTLKTTIESLAQDFAVGVLAAIRSASLQDILAETSSRDGRNGAVKGARAAATAAPAGKAKSNGGGGDTLSAVTSLLSSTPSGLRAEQIRQQLKLDKPTVTKTLTKALAAGVVKKQGQKRATTYFAR